MRKQELLDNWRRIANELRDWGCDPQAKTLERAASELEQSIRERDDELLTLTEAARQSGYSIDHVGLLVRRGILKNHGRKHAPRIRRADLPARISPLRSETDEGIDRVQIARAVADSYRRTRDG